MPDGSSSVPDAVEPARSVASTTDAVIPVFPGSVFFLSIPSLVESIIEKIPNGIIVGPESHAFLAHGLQAVLVLANNGIRAALAETGNVRIVETAPPAVPAARGPLGIVLEHIREARNVLSISRASLDHELWTALGHGRRWADSAFALLEEFLDAVVPIAPKVDQPTEKEMTTELLLRIHKARKVLEELGTLIGQDFVFASKDFRDRTARVVERAHYILAGAQLPATLKPADEQVTPEALTKAVMAGLQNLSEGLMAAGENVVAAMRKIAEQGNKPKTFDEVAGTYADKSQTYAGELKIGDDITVQLNRVSTGVYSGKIENFDPKGELQVAANEHRIRKMEERLRKALAGELPVPSPDDFCPRRYFSLKCGDVEIPFDVPISFELGVGGFDKGAQAEIINIFTDRLGADLKTVLTIMSEVWQRGSVPRKKTAVRDLPGMKVAAPEPVPDKGKEELLVAGIKKTVEELGFVADWAPRLMSALRQNLAGLLLPEVPATGGIAPELERALDKDGEQRKFLLAAGWEQVMTEEDGCETWTYPWKKREGWPAWTRRQHGTQHYWDLAEAHQLQVEVDGSVANVSEPVESPQEHPAAKKVESIPLDPDEFCKAFGITMRLTRPAASLGGVSTIARCSRFQTLDKFAAYLAHKANQGLGIENFVFYEARIEKDGTLVVRNAWKKLQNFGEVSDPQG